MSQLGKVYTHVVDNYDAMGWRITFNVKVMQKGLEVRWDLEVKVPESFEILENGIRTGKTIREFNAGGVMNLPWWQITPYPTPEEEESETLRFGEN